jgi:hypothetical protein
VAGVLSKAAWLHGLTDLDLSFNPDLGSEGFAAIAGLSTPRLARLGLRFSGVSAVGLRSLALAPWLPQLQGLALDDHVGSPADRRACLDDLSREGGAYQSLTLGGCDLAAAITCEEAMGSTTPVAAGRCF